jgi:hypothetical protein
VTAGGREPDLSAFQLEVAQLFFALPASRGFLLARGSALLAQRLTTRPTEDFDFFTGRKTRSTSASDRQRPLATGVNGPAISCLEG